MGLPRGRADTAVENWQPGEIWLSYNDPTPLLPEYSHWPGNVCRRPVANPTAHGLSRA
jgi:hypothetical protein